MDPTLLIILVIALAALLVGTMWRQPSGRARTPEEHLEQAALKAEQDRTRTEAIYRDDRFNLRD